MNVMQTFEIKLSISIISIIKISINGNFINLVSLYTLYIEVKYL